MANVSVYNMEGKEVGALELNDAVLLHSLQINVREHRKQRHVLRFPAAAESRGDRKEPVMQDRVQPGLLSGRAAVSYSLPHQEITPSD